MNPSLFEAFHTLNHAMNLISKPILKMSDYRRKKYIYTWLANRKLKTVLKTPFLFKGQIVTCFLINTLTNEQILLIASDHAYSIRVQAAKQ